MAQKKDVVASGQKQPQTHFMGKRTGYDLIDGKYHLAPMYTQQMDDLRDEERGLADLIASINAHLKGQFTALASRKRGWWDRVLDDLSLANETERAEWVYVNGAIFRRDPTESEADSAS